MNNDLISRSALCKEYEEYLLVCESAGLNTAHEMLEAAREFPAADAEPVRHGVWEWYEEWSEIPGLPAECEEAGWRCSECKINLALYLTANTDEIIYIDDSGKMPTLERCPKCGTKMDVEVDAEVEYDE